MCDLLSSRGQNWRKHPSVLILVGAILLAFASVSSVIVIISIHTPLAKEYGIHLSLGSFLFIPIIIVASTYSKLGVPIARSLFGEPFSRQAILLQMLLGPFVLLVSANIVEITIIFVIQIVTTGKIGQSYAFLILVWPTAPAAILGVWGGLILNWSVQHIPRLNTG